MDIAVDGDTVYWSECRPAEQGRYVVCSVREGSTEVTQWTAAEYNARTTVHEYGGGALMVSGGHVYFSNMRDQRLYKQVGDPSNADHVNVSQLPGLGWIQLLP